MTAGPETPAKTAKAETPAPRKVVRRRIGVAESLERLGVPVLLVVLIIVFAIALPATFPTMRNASGILSTEAVGLMLAFGALVPLVCGEFDLSIGFVLSFSSMLVAVLTINQGWNVWVASLVTIVVAALLGAFNALLVQFFRISSFIATLASGTVLSGITLLISDSTIVTGSLPDSYTGIGSGGPGGIAPAVFMALAVGLILYYVLEHTPTGRRMEAIGQGRDAARLAGVKVNRLVVTSLIVSGGVAGLCGVVNTATQGSADPSVGPGFLLPALAAAFLGATTIRPGRFNIIGTLLSVLLLAVGVNGLSQLGTPQWVGPVFNGGVLLLAVGAAQLRRRSL
ncbi:ABC transporter permease [Nakamurella sp. YIM 132087]|uniref:ABC transporter permease n=1 Tax=Nakamurella alba TaxID=2665158 RepID=A0A7K1FP75_9ACTN|nr:ABC transporter permease [Nakamurella alba]MTD15129.1 ABC transporter permease [Nakamurella alba]